MASIGRSGWNTLAVGDAVPDPEGLDAVDVSYSTIVAKIPGVDVRCDPIPRCHSR